MTAPLAEPHGVLHLARAVAAFGLAEHDEDGWTDPDRPLHPSDWATLLGVCRGEATVGLLGAAVAQGCLPATDEQALEVEFVHSSLMGTVVLLEQILSAASVRLGSVGVDHRVLKGSAYAWLDWPDPALRTFVDVDVLLADDYARGLRALEAGGWRRRSTEVHPGFDSRFGKGTTMVGPTGHEVDLHRTLAAGPFGLLIGRDELLEGGELLVIGGSSLTALARPQRLVHACYHAALGARRARHATLRDVGELVLGCTTPERQRALELAESWSGSAAVALAISEAAALLRLPAEHPLVRWSKTYRPTRRDLRRLSAYRGPGRSFGAQAIEGWRVLPTLGERLAYGRQLLLAAPDHLQARGESSGHRWARAAHLVTGRRWR